VGDGRKEWRRKVGVGVLFFENKEGKGGGPWKGGI